MIEEKNMIKRMRGRKEKRKRSSLSSSLSHEVGEAEHLTNSLHIS